MNTLRIAPIGAAVRPAAAECGDGRAEGRHEAMQKPVYVLNGPNLNMLGLREPHIYGSETLDDVRIMVEAHALALGMTVNFRQSNIEGELVNWIQEARSGASAIVLNAGAYTHTSIAILDALNAAELPVVEVHLSNVYRRERFRHRSFVSPAALGVICGFGPTGYLMALDGLKTHFGAAKVSRAPAG
jgi:3-dehydroquinate dehydratase-2